MARECNEGAGGGRAWCAEGPGLAVGRGEDAASVAGGDEEPIGVGDGAERVGDGRGAFSPRRAIGRLVDAAGLTDGDEAAGTEGERVEGADTGREGGDSPRVAVVGIGTGRTDSGTGDGESDDGVARAAVGDGAGEVGVRNASATRPRHTIGRGRDGTVVASDDEATTGIDGGIKGLSGTAGLLGPRDERVDDGERKGLCGDAAAAVVGGDAEVEGAAFRETAGDVVEVGIEGVITEIPAEVEWVVIGISGGGVEDDVGAGVE